jgi:hypothetical protein
MIPATPEPKIPENGPEPEFRPEFFRNFEPRCERVLQTCLDHSTGLVGATPTSAIHPNLDFEEFSTGELVKCILLDPPQK